MNLDKQRTEVYELAYSEHGDYYRLIKIAIKSQGETELRYEHSLNGFSKLSDIISQPNTAQQQHIRSVLDASGRISAWLLMQNGEIVRTLARYDYDEQSDLIAATDEYGHSYSYTYDHHLLIRYVDRNGVAVNLEYDGKAHNSRAIHEWSDDGTMENWLIWDMNKNILIINDTTSDESTVYLNDPDGYTHYII